MTPATTPGRTPCWHCRHLRRLDVLTMNVSCEKIGWTNHGTTGCQQWEREPGIDDDDWTPTPPPFVPVPEQRRDVGRDGWWTEPRRPPRPPAPRRVIPIGKPPWAEHFEIDEV